MTERIDCEIAVVGLGVMGAMTLWQAARRSRSVVGIEQFERAHARGSSHGGSRIFRRIVTEGSAYVPLVRRADALWDELARESGTPLRITTGGITIGTEGSDYLQSALAAAAAGQVEVETLAAAAIRRRFPQHGILDDDAAVVEPGAGVVFPEVAIRAAIGCAVEDGAEIRTDERVTSLTPDEDGVLIRTRSAEIRAGRAVVSAGAWLPELLPGLEVPIRVQRSVPYLFEAPPGGEFGSAAFPVFRRQSHHLRGWGIPEVDGCGVKIGVSGAPKPWLRRPEDNWVQENADDFALVRQFTAEAFPSLRDRPVSAHPCMNARTPDGDFVIGTSARVPGVVVLGGFGGHGFKHAPAVGEIAVDLALGLRPEVPIEAFSPGRLVDLAWNGPLDPLFDPTGRPAT